MKKFYTILFVWLFACALPWSLSAQSRTVNGKVTATEDDSPLPGVNVVIKGSSTGTVTDFEGNYSLTVPNNDAVLIFSFVGYAQEEVVVGARSTIDLQLTPDLRSLGEVVVTALGIAQDKKALGYSVQEVGKKEIIESREQNIVDALNAKVAGVQVVRQGGSAGAGSNINIRGISSISGTNQPLFVIDGIPMNNSFRPSIGTGGSVDHTNRAIDINPNDIENMTVLKGPAATALYGIQGSNGVILITTKRGAEGKTFSVDVSSNTSVDRIMNYWPQQMRYGQGDNGVFSGGTTFNHFGAPISTLRYAPGMNPKDANGVIVDMNHPDATNMRVPAFDNQELFFRDGFTTDNHVAVSNSTDLGNYYFSVGNMYQQGITPNNDFNRTSVKLSADTKIGDKFKISGTANVINSKSEKFGRGDNFSDVVQGLYRTPATFDNSAGFAYPNGVQRNFRGLADGTFALSPDNPFWTVNNNPYRDNVNRLITNLQADYNPTDWLSIIYRAGYDFTSDERSQRWAAGSAGGAAIAASGAQGGRLLEDTYTDRIFNSDLIVTATKRFSENFEANLMVGHNLFSFATNSLFMDGRNFAIPGLFNIANTTENPVFTQNFTEKQTQAAYSRLNLSYLDAIFLEVTGRNEWSSTLPAENRSFFYGSSSLGIVFTEFLNPNSTTFPFGKLKASFAQVGNDAPIYATETFYNVATAGTRYAGGLRFPVDQVGGALLSSLAGNPELRPETNTTWEIGTDLRFFQNRVGIDFTYYNSVSRDQILNVAIPASSGFTNQRINAGEIQNRGIEMMINATPVQIGEFRWDLIFNFTRNRNFVNELPNDEPIFQNLFGARIQTGLIPGEQFGVYQGNAFKRNEAGEMLIGPNGYPQFDPDGQQIIGNPNPDYLIGFRNSLGYKQFELSFLWDIRKGGDVVNSARYWTDGSGIADHTLDRNRMVVYNGIIDNPGGDNDGQPNDIAVPLNQAAIQGVGGASAIGREMTERWVRDGSWIRLRDVTLSYRLAPNALSRLGMKSATVGVYGRNLLLFTNYNGIDPETNLFGVDAINRGLDHFTFPNTRSYGITLNASF